MYISPAASLPFSQPDSDELKNASEEVARLFQKSISSSTSSPESTSNDVATLRQELRDLQQSYSKANVVGVVSQCRSHCGHHSPSSSPSL